MAASQRLIVSGKRRGTASAFSVGTLRSVASTRLRSSHLRRLPQNGVLTPLSSRSVCSASRKASLAPPPPRAAIRQCARRRRARGLNRRGPVPQPPAVIRFGKRSPLPQHPLLADAPPLAVERRAGVARLSFPARIEGNVFRAPARWWSRGHARRWRDASSLLRSIACGRKITANARLTCTRATTAGVAGASKAAVALSAWNDASNTRMKLTQDDINEAKMLADRKP